MLRFPPSGPQTGELNNRRRAINTFILGTIKQRNKSIAGNRRRIKYKSINKFSEDEGAEKWFPQLRQAFSTVGSMW